MDLVKNIKNDDVTDLIIRPQNSAVFGLYNFLRTYVNNEKLRSLIFNENEEKCIKRFIDLCIQIRTHVLT